ncbi:serine O-acetyltransferase [Sulfurospirillum deleyianum]|uniref:Serine acetyltransferase n=1 Tax=Sulfurospirillum deleyianum (strain ATCC 51133 / DSM 6946 / 5175) TaxID=525898 RepID=D1B2J0_SULD5|nr:serine O-acetyltransferase [Sulfurospirillum deleyianum]ACZ12310.1 serine O-acetyltransferase [Sulfurospirillum deleyianum DSM 6946]
MSKISLWAHIKEDFVQPLLQDPAINSKIELFFNYPGVWAVVNYRMAHALHVKGFRTLARVIMGISQIITNIDIHPACTIGRRVFLDHAFGVVIGETAIVGDDVLIYQGVTLGGVSLARGMKRHPTIGNKTVIGSGAKVLGDIHIGENCRIGSNSVVVKSIPDDSTAVGIPARIIEKGRDKNPMAHNKIPDINKELFIYMFKRIKILEEAVLKSHHDAKVKDDELESIYKCYLESVKE